MKIKLHKHLDKKIWDKDNNVRPIVNDMLLSIAWAYIDYVRNEYDLPIKNSDVKDIFIFGSITQLFYDKQSDIDMCVVLNFENMESKFPGLDIAKQLKLYYYDWAMIHICKIYGRRIDLNFQDEKIPEYNGRYRTGSIYSLMNNNWVYKPSVLSAKELKDLEKQSNDVYNKILHDYKIIKKNGFILDEIKKFYNNIIASKKYGLAQNPDCVLNPVYIAIRQFKHNGYIKKLRKIAIKKETDKYVLK